MNAQAKNSLETVLNDVVSFVFKETHLLARYEMVVQEGLGKLIPVGDDGAFEKRMNRVIEHLGGPPEFYLLRKDQEPPPADNYPEAIMREAFAVFYRARTSVLRAHLFMTGSSVLAEQPDLINAPKDVSAVFVKEAQGAFWEHAEAAYIRLYSFWDRVGQVLDFSFFNIRKFDQNGFTAVMDRIHSNAVPMDNRLKSSMSWKRLRTFQTSEKEDGLKWLLQRRNLVIHSLHLHPVGTEDEGVFKSQFNHLDAAHREKLRPREPNEEVRLLMGQLEKASKHFGDFLDIVETTPSRKRESYL
ncbi:hypothetical protein [Bradyrhizobium yuanmingense]|uniref:hypothetical protein n=1 Tax=Bradyrhizobium yuanmingense TaxID=108015 RepID=UPI0023B92526|nr:hypothetical protein [Bradyrhizobium yuanmingense]MDF0579226.1 hypothetical protein [Bradyrhizobium yuanmingense]